MILGTLILSFIITHPIITILIFTALGLLLNPGILYEEYLSCKRIYEDDRE